MLDWFRRKTWTTTDEEEFFAKLGRARKSSRAQYLKIQAIELVETEIPELLNVAEKLLNQMLAEYPDDNLEKSSAFHTLGDIYKLRNHYEKAISYYKMALEFEKVCPNVISGADLDYSELIVKTKNINLFSEVETILLNSEEDLSFPIEKYKVYSLLAIINKHYNRADKAQHYAKLAEENATTEISGFTYHKYLGIVKERDEWLDREAGLGKNK